VNLLPFLAVSAVVRVFVAKAGDVLRRPRIRRAMEGVTGAILIAFGIRLGTTDH
jgi:threonine/homoserine/homoserine lactone efflux protein